MIWQHKVGDRVRLKGSQEALTITDQFWLQNAPWYGVKTRWGLSGVSVRENQLEATDDDS
jgi:hypothetical protein